MPTKKIEVYIEGWACSTCQINVLEPAEDDSVCPKCSKQYKEGEDFAFDETTVEFPSLWEICGDCRGTCSTYLGWAAKDQPALTACEFAEEGQEFSEDYFSGRYDKPCPVCKATGKILVIDEKVIEEGTDKNLKVLYEAYLDQLSAHAETEAIYEMERRFGC